jgi:hypothetical protein
MEKLEVNKYIPFGATLQEVLKHPTLTGTKLKSLLKSRGIFIESSEDNDTFPLLLSTILSPEEFEFIKENLKSKEDTQKITSRPLEWHNREDLIKVVPDKIDLKKILADNNSRYKIISQTNFAPVDGNPNRVKMEFRCQTNNYNSSWYRSKNEYTGEVILEKVEKDNKVYLKMIYTSDETQQIADLAVKHLAEVFRKQNYTKPNSVLERILYNSFNNEERVIFFLSLTGDSKIFQFQRATDLDIGPDKTMDLPVDMKRLMSGSVNELKMSGESLHENYLLNTKTNHQFIEIASIEAIYNFSYYAAEGNCIVRFGFNGYFKKRMTNIEFSIDVSSVNLNNDFVNVNREKVKIHLLQEFEKFKTEKYNYIKEQRPKEQTQLLINL